MSAFSNTRVSFELRREGDAALGLGHTFAVNALALSAAADRLYTGGRDGAICEWELVEGEARLRRRFEHHLDRVNDLALASADDLLVSGGSDGAVKLWSLESGRVLRTYSYHSDYVKAIALSKPQYGGSQMICSAGFDGNLFLWDLADHIEIPFAQAFHTSAAGDSVYAMAMTPGASLIFAGSSSGKIRIYDVASSEKIGKLRSHSECVKALAINSQGQLMVSSAADKQMKLWDLRVSHRPTSSLQPHSDTAWSLSCDFDAQSLISSGKDGRVIFTDLRTLQSNVLVEGDRTPIVRSLHARGPSTQSLWLARDNGSVESYWSSDGAHYALSTKLKSKPGILKADLLPDKYHVVTLSTDDRVELWDVTKASRVEEFTNQSAMSAEDFYAHMMKELQTKVNIPSWMSIDTKSGALVVHLDYPACFNCEVGLRDAAYAPSVVAQRSVGQKDEELGTLLFNVGERVIAALFKVWCAHFTEGKARPATETAPKADPTLEVSLAPMDASGIGSSQTSSTAVPSPTEEPLKTDAAVSSSSSSSSGAHYRPPNHLFDVQQARTKPSSKWWKYDQGVEHLPAARGGTDVSVASILHADVSASFAQDRYSYYYKHSTARRYDTDSPKSSAKGKEHESAKKLLALEHLVDYAVAQDVVVSVEELDPKTQFSRVLYRKAVKDFDGTELVPQFVFDALIERYAPCETVYRLPIVLSTEDDFFPTSGSRKKFQAPRCYRMERISRYLVENLELTLPTDVAYGDYVQILCRDQVMDPAMTLASVKHFYWKSSADVALVYRLNDKYRKK